MNKEIVHFACPACGHKLKIKAKYGGRAIKCPHCQAKTQVPLTQAAATEPPVANTNHQAMPATNDERPLSQSTSASTAKKVASNKRVLVSYKKKLPESP